MSKYCTFLIEITKENKTKCSIITEENKELPIPIRVKEQLEEEYLPIVIEFDMNEIIIGKPTENSIIFMEKLMINPTEFKKYKVSYQGKEEEVIAEVLFALFINKFKEKIEKEYIIDEVIVETAEEIYQSFSSRLTTSLKALGLKNIFINPVDYPNYQKQGEILHDVLTKVREFKKYKSLLIKANQEQLITNQEPLNEDKFNEIARQLTMKERTTNGLCHLDNYCLFLASKYFPTVEDHINLVRVCKRMRLNMEKFHFNPFPLTNETREFFPNLKELFIYNREDILFQNDKRIIARKIQITPYYLSGPEKCQIEKWTGSGCEEVVFDSDIHNWSINTSVFDVKIIGRRQLVFVIEDERGEKFGYYLNTEIKNEYNEGY